MPDPKPLKTEFRNVVLEKTKRVYVGEPRDMRVRPKQGAKLMKIALQAMNDGHTVAMSTRYDTDGNEIADVDIIWDGDEDHG